MNIGENAGEFPFTRSGLKRQRRDSAERCKYEQQRSLKVNTDGKEPYTHNQKGGIENSETLHEKRMFG